VLVVAEGTVVPSTSVAVHFPFAGIVTDVLVTEGQQVRVGDALASLDTRQIQLEFERAQIALEQSRLAIKELRAGPSPAELRLNEARTARSRSELREVLATINANDVMAAQERVSSSSQSLTEIAGGPKTTDLEIRQAELDQARANLQKVRDELSANKSTLELQVAQLANDLRDHQAEYSRVYWNNRGSAGESATLDQGQLDAEAMAMRAVENTEIEIEQARLAYEESVKVEASGIKVAEANVRDAQARLDALLAGPDPSQLSGTRANIARDSATLERLTGENREASIATAQSRISEAEAALAMVQSSISEVDIARAELAISTAEVSLKQIQLELDMSSLRAPINGVVALMRMRVGDSAEGAFIQIADYDTWRIETRELSELDVVRIREGGKALLNFVALPSLQIEGTVERLILVQGADGQPAYKAIIAPSTWDDRLRWHMSSSVAIISE